MKVFYQKAKVDVYGRLFVADLSLPLGQGLMVVERCESHGNIAELVEFERELISERTKAGYGSSRPGGRAAPGSWVKWRCEA